jgi:heavy metal translocating P-type ATPase
MPTLNPIIFSQPQIIKMLITSIIVGSIAAVYAIKNHKKQKEAAELSATTDLLVKRTTALSIDKKIDNDFKIATLALVFTIAGRLIYAPLLVIGVVGLSYLVFPIWRRAYHDLVHRHRITRMVVESLVLPGVILSGYFLAAAITYWFLYFAIRLMTKAKGRTTNTLESLFVTPSSRLVWVQNKSGIEMEILLKEVKVGDIVIIQAGELVPVDGIIVTGSASIDQHRLTGESQPVDKDVGDLVFATTLVLSGRIHIKVEKTGKQTISAQIGQTLTQMTQYTDLLELRSVNMADRWALPILMFSGLAAWSFGAAKGLAILWFPLDDVLYSTGPLGVLNYLDIALKRGILVKDGRVIELLREVDTIVFDKTGTLTEEQPHVAKIHVCGQYTETELLSLAAAAEHKQTHPIARAILQAAQQEQLDIPKVQEIAYEIGYGLKVKFGPKTIYVGSERFMQQLSIAVPEAIQTVQNECDEVGHSLIYVAIDDKMAGAIELHATIRSGAQEVINQLKQQGYDIYIISGDHEKPTKSLAQAFGIEHYFAQTLPEEKASLIEELQNAGKSVCYIGDGINDSIALKKAQVSVSLRGASTLATDTAQVILMNKQLEQLIQLIDLAKQLESNLDRTLISGLIPTATIVVGVFALHLSLPFAIGCYMAGMTAGVGNAMWPIIKQSQKKFYTQNGKKLELLTKN